MNKGYAVKFINDEHRHRFFELVDEDRTDPDDVERLQLFYVISGCDDLYAIRTSIYDPMLHRLTFESIRKLPIYDSDSYSMLKRALHLYNPSHKDIDTYRLLSVLDHRQMKICLNALKIYCKTLDGE